MAEKLITIIGCGPGARECITLEALEAARDAEVLVGSQRLLDLFADAVAHRIAIRGYRDECYAAIDAHAHKKIAVLVTGDPGIASLATPIIDRYGLDRCRIIAGLSSMQIAFARLGISWEGARIFSAHAALPSITDADLQNERLIAVLTGNRDSLAWVAHLGAALGDGWRMVVAQDLTLETESIMEIDSARLTEFQAPLRAVVLLIRKEQQ